MSQSNYILNNINITLADITTILTALIAVGGLLLSIYNLRLSRKDKQVQLNAILSSGFIPHGPELGELMLILEVTNPGEKSAKINSVEILWRKRPMIFFRGIPGTTNIPFTLEPGDSATFWTPVKGVCISLKEENAKGKVKLRSRFRTAINTNFVSKPYILNIHEWIN